MALIIVLCLVLITFVAITLVIVKAGFSRAWIFVPLTPLACWVATIVVIRIQLHAFVSTGLVTSFYPGTIGTMFELDWATLGIAWIFFLVFAFSSWPMAPAQVSSERSPTKGQRPQPVHGGSGGGSAGPRNAPGQSGSRYPMPRGPGFGTLGFVAGPATATHESAMTPGRSDQLATFCSRCGDSIPGNRALAHNCPKSGEPATHCRYCGKSYPEGAEECPSCNQPVY
jgi:hypothetical protein